MHKKAFWTVALAILAFFVVVSLPGAETAHSQAGRPQVTTEQLDKRRAIENELQSIAIVERKLMIPMRDGVKIATDVYRPKDTSKKYATIFVRTPYNFNYWDIRNSAPRDLSNELEAVKRGYAFVEMNERGRFFSEGNYDILGPPLTDGVDEFNWISKQTWSNGKVGTIGCSSTAEWQLAVAAQGNPAYTTFIPQGFGAGVGRVAPYFEQGNWYRGGAVQMLFIAWLYGQQNQVRPMFAPNTSQEDLIRASKSFDLAPQLVVGTNRIATVPTRLACKYAKFLPLKLLPLPIDVSPLVEKLQWHTAELDRYLGWNDLLSANGDARLELDIDDWLYFFATR